MGVGLARALCTQLLAAALLTVSGPCDAESSARDVFTLINERLSFMKNVAV